MLRRETRTHGSKPCILGAAMALSDLKDTSILTLYSNIREQVDAARGHKHKFLSGSHVRQYANALQEELIRRRVPFTPILRP
jgi:hypothetical protein